MREQRREWMERRRGWKVFSVSDFEKETFSFFDAWKGYICWLHMSQQSLYVTFWADLFHKFSRKTALAIAGGSAQWRILSSQIEPAISLSQRPLGIQQIRQDHPRCQTSFDRLTWTGWGRGAHRDVHGWRLPRSWDWRHWDCGVAESVAWKERWPVWNQVVYRVYALYFKFNFGLFRDLIVSAAPARYTTCVLHGTQRREMVFFLRPLLQVGCSMACGKPVSCLCLLAGRTESLDDGESRRQHWGWRYLLFKSGCLERGLVFSLRKYPFPSFNDP